MADIKTMALYRDVDRIRRDLRAAGFGDGAALTVVDLVPYDQMHYEGTGAVDDGCKYLQAGPGRKILDIGAGIGGPARYIADRTGAHVTALELQADLNASGIELTERCGLQARVSHVAGDFLSGIVPAGQFGGILSMLCFLHIPDRAALLAQCARVLAPGGRIFIDDYVARAELNASERASLADKLYCTYLPPQQVYIADLGKAGFTDIQAVDKTADWKSFVVARLDAFRAQRTAIVERYGAVTCDSLDDFYGTVAGLFTNGRVGGVRITAQLPG